jgi:hypothetical protein
MATMTGWAGRRVLNRNLGNSYLPNAEGPALYDSGTGRYVFWVYPSSNTASIVDVYTLSLYATITLTNVSGSMRQAIISIGGYIYAFWFDSSNNVNVTRVRFTDWSNSVLKSTATGTGNYGVRAGDICYDGSDVVYFTANGTNSVSVYSYSISGNSFTVVKTFAYTSALNGYGMGILGSTLYFTINGTTFYSLDTGGVTLTSVRTFPAAMGMSGWKGYHRFSTILYNAGESLSWTLAETPINGSVMFIIDDVAATPKLFYTSVAKKYHEALGSTDLVSTFTSTSFYGAIGGIFPLRPGGSVDYSFPLVMRAIGGATCVLEAASTSREVG